MQIALFRKGLVLGIVVLFIMSSFASGISIEQKIQVQQSSRGTLYVGGSGPNNYTKIQDAIDNASNGDTVFVFDDSSPYYENIVINKSIELIGEDKNTTIIDGNYLGNIVNITADLVTVKKFTIKHSLISPTSCGIFINSSDYSTIIENIFINIHGGGILYYDSNYTEIYSNIFINNSIGIWSYAYNNKMSYNLQLIGNTISNSQNGIYIANSDCINISENKIFQNQFYAIWVGNCKNININKNSLTYNQNCLKIYGGNNSFVEGNIISYNSRSGITLQDSTSNEIICNTVNNNNKWGIILGSSEENLIYYNDFFGQKQNVETYSSSFNQWDNGYNGNYWDDYTGEDNDGNGIGDTPYPITGGDDEDRYPLMTPYNINSSNLSYEVSRDNGIWINTGDTTSYTFTDLKDGYHNFSVRTVKNSKRTQADKAQVYIDAPPWALYNGPIGNDIPYQTNVSIGFSEEMDKTSVENGFSITPSVAGSIDWMDNTLLFIPDSGFNIGTQYTVKIKGDVVDTDGDTFDGNHNGYSEGSPTDDLTWTFIATSAVDNSPPSVTITYPVNNSYLQEAVVHFYGDDIGSGIAYYEVKIDNDAWIQTTDTIYNFDDLAEGEHYLSVRGVDLCGNDGSIVKVNTTVDITPPNIIILAPVNNTNTTVSRLGIYFNSTSEDINNYEVKQDNGEWINLGNQTDNSTYNGVWYIFRNMSDGTHILYAKAVDFAGNEDIYFIYIHVRVYCPPKYYGPKTTIISPTEGTCFNVDDIEFSFYSPSSDIDTFEYSFNAVDYKPTGINATVNTTYNYIIDNCSEGNITVFIRGVSPHPSHGYDNHGFPDSVNLTVTSFPKAEIYSPTNNSHLHQSVVTLSYGPNLSLFQVKNALDGYENNIFIKFDESLYNYAKGFAECYKKWGDEVETYTDYFGYIAGLLDNWEVDPEYELILDDLFNGIINESIAETAYYSLQNIFSQINQQMNEEEITNIIYNNTKIENYDLINYVKQNISHNRNLILSNLAKMNLSDDDLQSFINIINNSKEQLYINTYDDYYELINYTTSNNDFSDIKFPYKIEATLAQREPITLTAALGFFIGGFMWGLTSCAAEDILLTVATSTFFEGDEAETVKETAMAGITLIQLIRAWGKSISATPPGLITISGELIAMAFYSDIKSWALATLSPESYDDYIMEQEDAYLVCTGHTTTDVIGPIDSNSYIGNGQGLIYLYNNQDFTVYPNINDKECILMDGPVFNANVISKPESIEPNTTETIEYSYYVNLGDIDDNGCEYSSDAIIWASKNQKVTVPPTTFKAYDNENQQEANMAELTTTNVLSSGELPTRGNISIDYQTLNTSKKVIFSLTFIGGDLDLHLYDESGKHVGVNYLTGEIENQLDGATYEGPNSMPERIILTENTSNKNFTIEIVPVDIGVNGCDYTLLAREIPQTPTILELFPKNISTNSENNTIIEIPYMISETGGFFNLENVTLVASDLSGDEMVIDASNIQFSENNFTINASCDYGILITINISENIISGLYTGKINVTADDGSTDESILNITVQDKISPTIIDHTLSIGYTGDNHTFNATIIDNIEVSTASIEYWMGLENHTTLPMYNVFDDFWEATITINHTLDKLHYIISANDVSNNWNWTDINNITIYDNDKPLIFDVQAIPSIQLIDDCVNISAIVNDNIEVDEVYLYIKYPDSTIENFSITQNKTGDTYYCNKTYQTPGVYTYYIWANDTSGNQNVSTDYTFEIVNTPPNTPSQPSGPASGDICISYNYSTSTTDPDGDDVCYGWDWDDGSPIEWSDWYSSGETCIMSHSWDDPGTYDISVKAKDIWDDESGWSPSLSVTIENNPPYTPSNPDPADGTTDVEIDSDLSWTGGDPDSCNSVTYDVYLGDYSPPPLVSSGQSETTYDPGTLDLCTIYYWKIVAEDEHGATTEGSIWSFTTRCNNPPNPPSNPDPQDDDIDVDIDADLSWTCSDPDGDPLTYDVYFGTSSNPPLEASGITEKTYDPGTMDYETTYYWKIVADDGNGTTESPIWNFTTEEVPNNPPLSPDIVGPANGNTGIEYDYIFNAVDPDGDNVKYYIDWGDETTDETDLNPSGIDIMVSHTWTEDGTYIITAYAEDATGLTGPSSTLEITMPRDKAINKPFLNFLNSHPNMFPLLQRLLGL